MGIVRIGPPKDFILKIRNDYKINIFIETGTYLGNTTRWAQNHFQKAVTIEVDEKLYRDACELMNVYSNVECLQGSSKDKLQDIVNWLDNPAIFWLDAHWSGGVTYGENEECPLLEEIRTINKSDQDHVLLIDDARLFLSPPPKPHLIKKWPDIISVLNALTENKKRYLLIMEDVIFAVPEAMQDYLAKYAQENNTLAWMRYGRDRSIIKKIISKFKRWTFK